MRRKISVYSLREGSNSRESERNNLSEEIGGTYFMVREMEPIDVTM